MMKVILNQLIIQLIQKMYLYTSIFQRVLFEP